LVSFSESWFSLKGSYGQIECSFDNAAEILRQNLHFLKSDHGNVSMFFFQKNYSGSKRSTGCGECRFDKPAEHFPIKFQKLFAQSPKMKEEKTN